MDDYFGPLGDSVLSGVSSGLGTIIGGLGTKYLGLQSTSPVRDTRESVEEDRRDDNDGASWTVVAIVAGVGVLALVLVLALRK